MFSPSIRSCSQRLTVLALSLLASQLAVAQRTLYSTAHRGAEQRLLQTLPASAARATSSASSEQLPLSLVVADFDEDGIQDLVTGNTAGPKGVLLIQSGKPHALAPDSAHQAQLRAGGRVAPFVATTSVAVPVRPDLLATVDMEGMNTSILSLRRKETAPSTCCRDRVMAALVRRNRSRSAAW